MKSDRTKIKVIVYVTTGTWFLSMAVFAVWGICSKKASLDFVCLYGICNLGIFSFAYRVISQNVNLVMYKVNNCIQCMIDGQAVQNFSIEEESLLGKFQMQILKLYEILDSSREHEEKMRKEIMELVADLVHQVNTPLTNIQMYSGFLVQDKLSKEEKADICKIINTQVEKLGWFANGFTKTARLEENMRRLKPEKQPILPIILSAINEVSLKAKQHRNEICLEGDQHTQAFYDRRWTEEAIFNLLDNAVKYGEEGTRIQVKMSAYELYVRVDVINYGDPIVKEEYPKLFNRFYRGKNAALIREGVGLGLYLTRQIILEQGGYIKVGNLAQKGNIFSVFLLKK